MDTNNNTLLSYRVILSMLVCLCGLTACTARVEASFNTPAPATQLPTQLDAVISSEVETEEFPKATTEGGQYINEVYALAFDLMPGWKMTEYPLGDGVNGYPPSRVVELSKDGYHMVVHIKYWWDPTVIGGGFGPGEVITNGYIAMLDRKVSRNLLVNEGLTKQVWWGERYDDLELYLRLEDASAQAWKDVNINEQIIADAENMIGSFFRIGEPISPPDDLPLPPGSTSTPGSPECKLSPRLSVNEWAQVTPGLPNVVRSEPGRGAGSEVLGEIQAGRNVLVLDGPVCSDSYYWWQVDAGLITGWTPEGSGNTYWLTPLSDGLSAPVDGWVGTLVSAAEMPQVDDYFQVLDQGGSRFGIHALDPELRQQLEANRDTGTLLSIWGTLYYGRMDAYNSQIEVSRFEVYTP